MYFMKCVAYQYTREIFTDVMLVYIMVSIPFMEVEFVTMSVLQFYIPH
jgi:multisubunit Na+/H+ antiporter MnhF subunit